MSDIANLTARMRLFTEERDWSQFHDPKSLILALVGEVGELAELFQWLPADEAVVRAAQQPLKERCGEEMSDVLLYLLRLADVLSIDLTHAANMKLDKAQARFVAKDVSGTAPIKT
jgi:NTP pyrophosphatase (non-canonical NTP hydrolase)